MFKSCQKVLLLLTLSCLFIAANSRRVGSLDVQDPSLPRFIEIVWNYFSGKPEPTEKPFDPECYNEQKKCEQYRHQDQREECHKFVKTFCTAEILSKRRSSWDDKMMDFQIPKCYKDQDNKIVKKIAKELGVDIFQDDFDDIFKFVRSYLFTTFEQEKNNMATMCDLARCTGINNPFHGIEEIEQIFDRECNNVRKIRRHSVEEHCKEVKNAMSEPEKIKNQEDYCKKVECIHFKMCEEFKDEGQKMDCHNFMNGCLEAKSAENWFSKIVKYLKNLKKID